MKADFSLHDRRYFQLGIGKRRLKVEIFGATEGIPLYSANALKPFGYVRESNVTDFGHDYVLWGIDGDFMFNAIPKGTEFATTDHCGTIKILHPAIIPEYLLYQLELQGHALGFDRGLRASLANMSRVTVRLPVKPDGTIDRDAQTALVEKYLAVKRLKARLQEEAESLSRLIVDVPQPGEYLTVRLEELFDLKQKTNRSDFTKRYVNERPGPIPVYSASGDEERAGYGYVADNLPGIKYFQNILTWNIDGSKFRAFYREGRFSLSEKVIPLVLRPEWEGLVDYNYIRHIIDRKAVEAGAAYQNKPGKGRIKDLELEIPARREDGALVPDLDGQRALAERYRSIYTTQARLVDALKELAATYVDV